MLHLLFSFDFISNNNVNNNGADDDDDDNKVDGKGDNDGVDVYPSFVLTTHTHTHTQNHSESHIETLKKEKIKQKLH